MDFNRGVDEQNFALPFKKTSSCLQFTRDVSRSMVVGCSEPEPALSASGTYSVSQSTLPQWKANMSAEKEWERI